MFQVCQPQVSIFPEKNERLKYCNACRNCWSTCSSSILGSDTMLYQITCTHKKEKESKENTFPFSLLYFLGHLNNNNLKMIGEKCLLHLSRLIILYVIYIFLALVLSKSFANICTDLPKVFPKRRSTQQRTLRNILQ